MQVSEIVAFAREYRLFVLDGEVHAERWRAVNAPYRGALVRAGGRFDRGVHVEREEVSAARAQ